ncbi:hypothetical protein [Microvirga sp. BSC39]|uniref:hypothetical protein n=1 Tax=Microvirga sp. BSC39 TaxID=1549810 RepID=UPI0004E90BB1|nr:hypothetical protein [Microvirga sp. BSC39]KFG68436.1 hypothetical protein JH26_17975 [Microvirga sp. BSC39]
MLRTVILLILGLGTAAWLWLLATLVLAPSDSVDAGWAFAAAAVPSAAFLAFALPALILALKGRHLGGALILALLSLISGVLVL